MIHNEFEYTSEVAQLADQHLQLAEQRERLKQSGLADDQIERATSQLKLNCQRLQSEIATYERRNAKTWVPALK